MTDEHKLHRALQPEIVEPAEPISVLASALLKLEEDNSKAVHLTPAQAATLSKYISSLEVHVIRLADVDKHRAKLEHELIKLSFMNWVE